MCVALNTGRVMFVDTHNLLCSLDITPIDDNSAQKQDTMAGLLLS